MLGAGESTNHSQQLQLGMSQTDLSLHRVLLSLLSSMLEKLVARNDRLADGLNQQLKGLSCGSVRLGKRLDAFHGVRAPDISIPKYLERIYKYTSCSPSCFVVGFVYIDRLTHRHPDSLILSLNVHRLLVTSVMVASKVSDDEHYNNNAVYARVGGVSNAEFNRLESELLFLLDFGVAVSSRDFECYCFHLEKEMLLNVTAMAIEKASTPNGLDDQISVEDNQSSSLPQIVEVGLT